MSKVLLTPLPILWLTWVLILAYIGGQEMGLAIFGSMGGLS